MANAIFLDVLFLVLTSIKTCAAPVPDINVDIKFRLVRENSVFDGKIIVLVEARSSMECGLQCMKYHSCYGINYEMKTGTQRTKTLCELIQRSDGGSNTTAVTERQGWKSYVLEQDTKPNNRGDNDTIGNDGNIETVSTTTTLQEAQTTFITTGQQLEHTTQGFEDTNPEFCGIQAAFVYQNQIYLLSGETVYTFTDVTQLSSGPIKTVRSTDLFPGISSLVTAIYSNSDETQMHVFEDDTVKTYSQPGSGLQWSLIKTESQSLFWGNTYSGVTGVFSQNGNVVILLGDKVTQLGVGKTCKYASNCSGNVLMANNKKGGPGSVTASCSLDNNKVIMFYDNLFYSLTKGPSETKGTWAVLGSVKCH